jgi:hypothetical protein
MSDLVKLRIWDDPAIRGALSWYLEVAENRRPAKFRIAATVATELDAASGEDALSAELDRLTPIILDLPDAAAGRASGCTIAGPRERLSPSPPASRTPFGSPQRVASVLTTMVSRICKHVAPFLFCVNRAFQARFMGFLIAPAHLSTEHPARLSAALWPQIWRSTQDNHLLLGHIAHRIGNSAHAVAGLAPTREWHPVGSKCRQVVRHDSRGIQALGGVQRDVDVLREDAGLERDRQRIGGGNRLI